MTLKRSSQILITLLLVTNQITNLLATRAPLNAPKTSPKSAINITLAGAEPNAGLDANTNINNSVLDSVDNNERILAPAIAGGTVVTPVFQYAIKASDFSTPTASWTSGATPTAGSTMYTINNSGRYYLASDVAAKVNASKDNTVMLYINCSNVILDLNSKTLYPAGNTTGQNGAGMTAILVAPNVSNVVITNGQINGYQPNNSSPTSYLSHGIVVSSGCRNLTISDLTITNIGGGTNLPNAAFAVDSTQFAESLLLLGATGTGNIIQNVTIQNVNITDTSNAYNTTDANVNAAALVATYCKNIKINDCSFNNSAATGESSTDDIASYGVYMSNSNTISFNNCTANENGSGATADAYGFFDSNSAVIEYLDCEANSINGYNTAGFTLGSNDGGPYKLSNCTSSNSTATQSVYGFHVSASAELQNCIAENNTATLDANGICLDSTDTVDNNGSKLINCQANNNSSSSDYALGFYIYDCNSAILDGCAANGNVGAGSQAAGIYVQFGDGCQIKNCSANENNSTTAEIDVFGIRLAENDGCIIDNCTTNHNFNLAGTPYVIGLYLETTNGTQVTNCQSRRNIVSSAVAGVAAGFYSYNGSANQFYNCQAINNKNTTAAATGTAAGIVIETEVSDQIVSCNCSSNTISTTATGTGYGIYLLNDSSNTLVRDCSLDFNVGAFKFGFYDDARVGGPYPTTITSASSSVLINNRAIGQGHCFPLPISTAPNYAGDYEFASNTSMNYFFYTLGNDGENPNMIIHETNNFNWKDLSTAVPDWSNISVAIGLVS